MNDSPFELLYAAMPHRMTKAAYHFFRDSFKVIEVEAYLNWLTVSLDDLGKAAGKLFLAGDEPLPADRLKLFTHLERHGHSAVDRWTEYEELHAQGVFSRVVDSFLTYITSFLTTIYKHKPQMLRSKELVSIDEMLSHKTMDELIESLVERKVHAQSYQGMRSLNATLAKELHFPLFDNDVDLNQSVALVEKRNLLAHARGVVNKVYLRRLPESTFQEGERLVFTRNEVTNVLFFLAAAVSRIDASGIDKFKLDESTLRERPKRNSARG